MAPRSAKTNLHIWGNIILTTIITSAKFCLACLMPKRLIWLIRLITGANLSLMGGGLLCKGTAGAACSSDFIISGMLGPYRTLLSPCHCLLYIYIFAQCIRDFQIVFEVILTSISAAIFHLVCELNLSESSWNLKLPSF